MNIALILAGGIGTRMKAEVPKQYLAAHGRSVISYCLQTFVDSEDIDYIWIVADRLWQQKIMTDFEDDHINMAKMKGFSNPGRTRQMSIMNGLMDIKDNLDCTDATIVIHDAARPMVTKELIASYIQALEGHDGVMPVLPMKDTVYLSEDGKSISNLLNRSQVYGGQTPEVFIFDKYYDACASLGIVELSESNGSSEPAVRAGLDVALVPGDETNFKITTYQDFEHFEKIIG